VHGKCEAGENCKYSHEELTDETRPLLDVVWLSLKGCFHFVLSGMCSFSQQDWCITLFAPAVVAQKSRSSLDIHHHVYDMTQPIAQHMRST